MLVCEKCKSNNVFVTAWVNVNTKEYAYDYDDKFFCEDCDLITEVINLNYYSLHIFESRNEGYSVGFISEYEEDDEIIDDAVEKGILTLKEADKVDFIECFTEKEFKDFYPNYKYENIR